MILFFAFGTEAVILYHPHNDSRFIIILLLCLEGFFQFLFNVDLLGIPFKVQFYINQLYVYQCIQ